ncbi:MAG TPA: hypothetical protein VGB00_04745 [Pyrinomonadaceae bacterium]
MKKNVFAAVALLCVFAAPVFTQTRKNTNVSTMSAFISAETGKSPGIKRPTEEAFGIWNEFSSEKHGFTIVFPSRQSEIRETGAGKIGSFETETEKAHYGVMRMKFPSLLDNRQLDILGESLFAGSYDAKTTKLISEKNVCLDGMAGKELIYEEAGKIFFTRFYIMEQKMFMLSVSLPKTAYTKDFDYWAMKFLDSFGAKRETKYIG